eukprot:TRINITY_DN35802_c0_g1_i1.p1 TRINITY_DN35802_c0_g1~~TRINITY_DN35802_c0_g1_i1.p1  ORF type:complete len:177 (-),score=28.07 TRINITY_DN35802_c0_g1_i1:99-629(-)
MDLWLIRGIPTLCSEEAFVLGLQRAGISKPALWYLPAIRKASQLHRGYGFIGYPRGSPENLNLLTVISQGRTPWPLQIEESTRGTERMLNNNQLWDITLKPALARGSRHHQLTMELSPPIPHKLISDTYAQMSRGGMLKDKHAFQELPCRDFYVMESHYQEIPWYAGLMVSEVISL